MMNTGTIRPIGVIHTGETGVFAEIFPAYRAAMTGLMGFGHIQLLWWFHLCEQEDARQTLIEAKPYRKGPEQMGAFATRSPHRPNPIGLSCVGLVGLDQGRGLLYLDYVDACDGTPLLDVKPYIPSLDRVAAPVAPDWCAHWPQDVETSGEFDWDAEFTL